MVFFLGVAALGVAALGVAALGVGALGVWLRVFAAGPECIAAVSGVCPLVLLRVCAAGLLEYVDSVLGDWVSLTEGLLPEDE